MLDGDADGQNGRFRGGQQTGFDEELAAAEGSGEHRASSRREAYAGPVKPA